MCCKNRQPIHSRLSLRIVANRQNIFLTHLMGHLLFDPRRLPWRESEFNTKPIMLLTTNDCHPRASSRSGITHLLYLQFSFGSFVTSSYFEFSSFKIRHLLSTTLFMFIDASGPYWAHPWQILLPTSSNQVIPRCY